MTIYGCDTQMAIFEQAKCSEFEMNKHQIWHVT